MKNWIVLFATISSVGCVSISDFPDVSTDVCEYYTLPPIPKIVTIKITDTIVETDEGGEQLLREYIRARQFAE